MQGFSVKWYGKTLSNPFVMDALENSLIVAFTSALCASVFGTMAAVALQGIKGPMRTAFDMLIYIAVMIPGIVIGIATLIGLVTVFDQLNPLLALLWPEGFTPLAYAVSLVYYDVVYRASAQLINRLPLGEHLRIGQNYSHVAAVTGFPEAFPLRS